MSRLSSSRGGVYTGGDDVRSKRRRGRQPRPCTLSSNARMACRNFSAVVGAPRVVEPAGFRDFVGWLQRIQTPALSSAWNQLLYSLLSDCRNSAVEVQKIQADVVREIISNVVTIRAGESSKLISTNARRQSSRPENGMTLMKIFDKALASATRSSAGRSANRRPGNATPSGTASSSSGSGRRHGHGHSAHSNSGPIVRLPSMQELEESLRRR